MRLRAFLTIVLLLAQVSVGSAAPEKHSPQYIRNRAKLLSFIIRKQITGFHYSRPAIDDELSKKAFDLYFKQVDPRKRFFLARDVEVLRAYETKLDDEIKSGAFTFPSVAGEMLKERVALVQKFLDEIEAAGIDYDARETLEVDRDKLSYCRDEQALKERWRKTIKYQVVTQYLDLIDIQKAQRDTDAKTANGADGEMKGSEKVNGGEAAKPAKSDSELRNEALEKVMKSNRDLLHRMERRGAQDNYDRFFMIIARALDPHSDYMPPTQKEDFDIHMRGSLEGIGAVLQEEDGYIKVLRIIPGGAAYRQKQLEAGDVIMMVSQGDGEPVDLADMRIRDAVALIRGKKGTEVRLTVKKQDGKIVVIPIIRDVVQLEETFVKSAVVHDQDGKAAYGYLMIPSFYRDFQATRHGGKGRNVTDDVKAALEKLKAQGIKGLVIDLRNNGGGALMDAVGIAGLFIPRGPVVQIRSGSDVEVLRAPDPAVYYNGPIIVLVNRLSASASEIFAGAMQDYHRALIVGSEHTYGKGTVQTLINLDENLPFFSLDMKKYRPLGALKLTTQKFYRVNGESTQHRGVEPDIVLPDRFKYSEFGEKYVDYSLPWDKIPPSTYTPWPRLGFDVETLRRESEKRVAANEKFRKIEEEAAEAKKRMDDTLVAIDLASVRAERETLKKFDDDRSFAAHGGTREEDLPDHELTVAEEEKQLVEKVKDDPYVTESLILLDSAVGP